MERVYFQVGVGVFNCQQILKQRFLSLSLMFWYKTNRMWLSVVCNLIDNDTGHRSRQDLLWNHWFIHACRHSKQNFHENLNGFLGQVQTPYFTGAESNANEGEQRIFLICIRFGSCEVRRLNLALVTFSTIFTSYLWRVSFRTLWRVWYSSEWHFLSLN